MHQQLIPGPGVPPGVGTGVEGGGVAGGAQQAASILCEVIPAPLHESPAEQAPPEHEEYKQTHPFIDDTHEHLY